MEKRQSKILQNRTDGWLKFAKELTEIIRCIIEFAKAIKGFQELKQDDQIQALKQTTFVLSLIAIAQVPFDDLLSQFMLIFRITKPTATLSI